MKKNNKLLENTFMLYLLVFSNYFFGFITVPYQTRILGPEIYGQLGFAVAFTMYFKLLFDFGFILSATEEVSKNRDNKETLSKILTSVTVLKTIFIAIGFIIMLIIINSFEVFYGYKLLYVFYFLYVAVDSLQPDYLFRGLENMKVITIRNVIIKSIFTALIIIFLKEKSQYLLVPIFMLMGSFFALIVVYLNVFKKEKIKLSKITKEDIKNEFNNSKIFFLSRIASTIYGATNSFVLGLLYPSGAMVGYYTSADKLLTTGKSACSPIADGVYPYMIKNKDMKLIKKLLTYLMPIIAVGCIVCFIFAKPICILLFGKEFAFAGTILRFMLPILFITLPTYLLGFPTLSPLGYKKQANSSVIIGSVFHLTLLLLLWIIKKINIYTICILTILTELLILLIRIFYVKEGIKNEKN